MSASKLDFSNIKPLALKIGGFPDLEKLNGFFHIIKKNKDHIGVNAVQLI